MSINVSDLAYSHPSGDELFFDISFNAGPGDHVGLVGVNGVGKSTLMRIIAGELGAGDGSVRTDGAPFYMRQAVGFTDTSTVRELLTNYAPKNLRDAGLRMIDAENRLATGSDQAGVDLGEAIADWSEHGGYELEGEWDTSLRRVVRSDLATVGQRPASTLSGGEVKQLVLDLAFSSRSNVLLLDEPDNYLDIPAKLALEERIKGSNKTVLLISHDRELLANATNKIVTLEGSGAWTHGASYATYLTAREQRQQLLGDELKRWKDEERRLYRHMKTMKERAKISDTLAPRANAAESKWKRFVDAGAPPAPVSDKQIHVRFRGGESGQRVIVAEAAGIDGLVLPFDGEIRQGERIGLIGPNGSGKSHLLRLFAKVERPSEGTVNLGGRVSAGMFTQVNQRPDFVGNKVEDVVARLAGNFERTMKILARYGLQGHAKHPYDLLSGGQKARLEILYLELEGHNLLLLDEPTDNLDIDSSDALQAALDGFEGTCVSVSHDRSFLREQDRFWLLDHDGCVWELLDFESASSALLGGVGKKTKLLTLR